MRAAKNLHLGGEQVAAFERPPVSWMGNSREVMQMQNPNNIVLHLPQIINVFVKRRHDDCSICTAVTAICR